MSDPTPDFSPEAMTRLIEIARDYQATGAGYNAFLDALVAAFGSSGLLASADAIVILADQLAQLLAALEAERGAHAETRDRAEKLAYIDRDEINMARSQRDEVAALVAEGALAVADQRERAERAEAAVVAWRNIAAESDRQRDTPDFSPEAIAEAVSEDIEHTPACRSGSRCPACQHDIAQLLAALEAERVAHAETRRERDEKERLWFTANEGWAKEQAKLATAEAALEASERENERLTGALERIADLPSGAVPGHAVAVGCRHNIVAWKALNAPDERECEKCDGKGYTTDWGPHTDYPGYEGKPVNYGKRIGCGCDDGWTAAALTPSTPPDLREDAP